MNDVHVVVPGDVDDVPSGGNVYDRHVCHGLGALGWDVREIAVAGPWPRHDAPELARRLADVPDGAVVLLDGLVACGVPEVVVPQATRLRVVILLHLPLADETGLDPVVAAELDARERETLRAASAVVATSPWAARRLARHHGVDADLVHTVVPGTDPAPLANGTDGALRLLCVASVTPRKGQDLLVQALARLTGTPWTCVLAGPLRQDSAYVRGLRAEIGLHGLGDRITLTGPLTGEPLGNAYSAADLLVLPSRAETFGMVVTEALARGIPVLATAVAGVPDTLGTDPDGVVPGILVPPENPAALAGALRDWFGDKDLRARLRGSARRRRGMLASWDETARRMAAVLEQVGE